MNKEYKNHIEYLKKLEQNNDFKTGIEYIDNQSNMKKFTQDPKFEEIFPGMVDTIDYYNGGGVTVYLRRIPVKKYVNHIDLHNMIDTLCNEPLFLKYYTKELKKQLESNRNDVYEPNSFIIRFDEKQKGKGRLFLKLQIIESSPDYNMISISKEGHSLTKKEEIIKEVEMLKENLESILN